MAATEAMETTEETTKTATKQGDISEAVNHLVQGKRHMLVQDYVSAVSSLEKACKLFADHYGETAKECGDPYLHYGKALLELSRMETGVLGHALQGVESEEDEDEEEAESDDKDSKDSDDQVENPDNVTGDESGEERELIIQQVGEALLENACELEKKMTELKGDKSGNLEVNGSASNLSNSKTESMEIETTSTESKDIPIMPKKAESQDDIEKLDEVEGQPSKDKTEDEKPQNSEAQKSKDKSEVQMDEKPDDQKPTADLKSDGEKPTTDLKSDDEKPASDIKSEEEKPVSDIVLASDIKPEEKPGSDIKSEEKLSSEETNDEKPTSDLKSEEKSVSDIKPDEEKPTSDGEKPASDIKTDEEKPKSDENKPEPEKEELKSDEEKPKPEKEELKSDEEKPKPEKEELKSDEEKPKTDGEPASDLKSDEDKPKPDEEKPSSDLKPDTEKKPTSDLKSDEEKSADSNLTEVTTNKGEAKSEDNSKSDAENIPAGDSDDKKDVKTDVEEMEVLEVESTTKDDKSVPKLEENIPKDIDDAKSEMKVPSGTHSLPNSKKDYNDSKDAKISTNAETDAKEKGSRNVETETNLPKAQSSSDSAQTKENDTKIAQDEEPMEIETSHPESKTQGEDQDGDGDESESIDEKSQDEEAVADDDEAAGPSDSGPSETKEKEDEVTNLQLAWEVLELAKVIFDRQADKDDKLKLQSAEVLLKLGEVSIESENYTQAIEDLNSCLDIQKKILTTDDRTVAETYYQLGLAFSLDNQFDNAVEHFTNAIRVLEERIANCRQLIERGKKETETEGDNDSMVEDPLDIAKREIEELEALIPDIKTKIEDTEDMKKTTTEAMKEEALAHFKKENLSGDSGGDVSTSIQASPSKPTSDVSHLVKRKRKPEEDVGNDSKDEIKKSKSDVDNVVPEQITNGNKMNGEQKMEASTVEVNAS